MIPESASVVLAVDPSVAVTETPTLVLHKTLRLPPPCKICGCREKWNAETRRYENPVHDMQKHFGDDPRAWKSSKQGSNL